MGADFLFATTPVPTDPDAAKRAIDELDDARLVEVVAHTWGWEPEDLIDEPETLDGFRTKLKEALDWLPEARTVAVIDLGNGPHYVTGMMSWGEASEELDVIWALDEIGVTDSGIAGPTQVRKALELVRQIAELSTDEEMEAETGHPMENDDAVDTLHALIGQARGIA